MSGGAGVGAGAGAGEHTALIVEDDLQIAEILQELVASLGHGWKHAVTLADVKRAAEEGGYCYVLLDMQIPADAGARPMVGSGETALALLRKKEPRRNEAGRHVLPILVVTGYSRDPEFVSKMYDAEADGFIAKPFGERAELVLDKVRACLERAARGEHEGCGEAEGLAGPPSRPSPGGSGGKEAEGRAAGEIAAALGVTRWEQMRFHVVDPHTVRIEAGGKSVTKTFEELGFVDTRVAEEVKPIKAWLVLLALCKAGRFRPSEYGEVGKAFSAKKGIETVRDRLREAFGIEENPMREYTRSEGWRARFLVGE